MTRRIVQENIEAPHNALRTYAAAVLVGTIVIRFLTRRSGFLEGMCLCALALLLVVYCHYHVRAEHEYSRRRFRIYLSALTATGCAILLSHGGLRARSLDLVNALVFGALAGVVTHLAGLVVGAVADLLLDRVRQFANPGECPTCGYDLRGLPDQRCPECGTPFWVPSPPAETVKEQGP